MNDHEYFEAFAINLKRLRKRTKKTQMEVAIDAEMSLSYYSGLEQGKQNPTLKQLRKLGEALSCEVRRIVQFKSPTKAKDKTKTKAKTKKRKSRKTVVKKTKSKPAL